MTLFLCGDVMTGRGIDQALPHPSLPRLREGWVQSAAEYLELAEKVHGCFSKPVAFPYIWGDAIAELERFAPDFRIINLETSITTSEDYEFKGIHYRMHPANTPCLTAAKIDCCVLANNHVLDWGVQGLRDTLAALRGAGLKTAGAGCNLTEALEPAVFPTDRGRLQIFAAATEDSGASAHWAASQTTPGIVLLPDLSAKAADSLARHIQSKRSPGDIVVFSIHWGGNWGYEIPRAQRDFAHRLVDLGAADVIYGHSSHHPKAIEVYKGRPVLYGCGDFLNDYEGISGYEEYRSDLVLMYFVTLDQATGELAALTMWPLRTRKFRLEQVEEPDATWLQEMLNREGQKTSTAVTSREDGALALHW